MKVLVANLGSTSFKYRLFDMADERQLACKLRKVRVKPRRRSRNRASTRRRVKPQVNERRRDELLCQPRLDEARREPCSQAPADDVIVGERQVRPVVLSGIYKEKKYIVVHEPRQLFFWQFIVENHFWRTHAANAA